MSHNRLELDEFIPTTMSSRGGDDHRARTANQAYWNSAVVLLGVVAVIALVFSAIAVARPGPTTSTVQPTVGSASANVDGSDKIWMFATGHSPTSNLAYLDETTRTVRGFYVDIVEAVCEVANKNCQLMWDVYENCYKSKAGERPRPGVGLLSRWYDGCVGWLKTYDRAMSVSFTDEFMKPLRNYFYVKRGNPGNFVNTNITGKTIGFMDGYSDNEICLKRNKIPGADLPSEKVRHFTTKEGVVNAINTGQVDSVFSSTFLNLESDLDVAPGGPVSKCVVQGPGIMVRVDSRLPDWWNPAFQQLKQSSEYKRICSEVLENHGHKSTLVSCLD